MSNEIGRAGRVRYAVPTEYDGVQGERVCAHFGHCRMFTLIDVDPGARAIVARQSLEPPEHEPGVLPRWLSEKGAHVVLAGGMGMRARQLLEDSGVAVVTGVLSGTPDEAVLAHLSGRLVAGDNACDHGHGTCGHGDTHQ
ncbi:MAG: NifB/NifX family molybdenum-iron cluster-binding protein [Planctomycetes bacterium]|nr:NifB/NifX family molybdenum-iron cluster-binding protein [Planctomycetota bacterium]